MSPKKTDFTLPRGQRAYNIYQCPRCLHSEIVPWLINKANPRMICKKTKPASRLVCISDPKNVLAEVPPSCLDFILEGRK